jgi:DNA-binding response OmpR family regulator
LSAEQVEHQVAAPQVTVVVIVTTPAITTLADELRRDAIQVDVGTVELLRSIPEAPVYLIVLDAAMSGVLAEQIVAWAATAEHRPGLIGFVDDGATREREALLAIGFDDAVAGRISVRELAGRIRAVHRRVHWRGASHGRLRYGALTLDLDGHSLWIEGKIIALTSIELAVVRELIKARGKPMSRADLLDAAWGDGEFDVTERAVDNVILRLRRKLPRSELIETVRSVGFRIAPR